MSPRKKTRSKPRPKPVIQYPPVETRKWIPPDKRKKKIIKPPQFMYQKPPGVTQPLELSSLLKIWHNFLFIDDGTRAIVSGSFSLSNKRFRMKSNGYQANCMCMVALAFSKLFDMSMWNTALVDKCLEVGDNLYNESLVHLEIRNPKKGILNIGEILPTFYVYDNKLTMDVKKEQKVDGKLFPDISDSPYLKNVIKNFFEVHDGGIIETQKKYFAVWASGGAYYMFDPADHDTAGLPWNGVPGTGYSSLGRFHNTDKLVQILHENVNKKSNDVFIIYPCTLLRMSRINRSAPQTFEDVIAMTPEPGKEEEDAAEGADKEKPKKEKLDLPSVRLFPQKKLPPPPPPPPRESEILRELELYRERQLKESEFEEFNPVAVKLMTQRESQIERIQTEEGGAFTLLDFQPRDVPSTQLIKDRPRIGSVTYFKTLIDGTMGILRARTHQTDPKFSKYLGKQSIPNAFAALTMLRFEKSKRWICKTLKEILELGEHLYHDSMKLLTGDQVLRPSTMIKNYQMRDKEFAPDVEEFSVVGRLNSTKSDVFDFLPAITEFFRDNETGVVVGPLTVAVWIEDGYYYMFDPNERDQKGLAIVRKLKFGSEIRIIDAEPGVACCTWFTNLKDLTDVYMNNVPKDQNKEQFYICRVNINDYIEIPDPWCNFEGISKGKWILRGHFSQADKRFSKENRNTQCTANATMSLVYSKLKKMCHWNSDTVDEILISGDGLYTSCVEYLRANNKFYDKMLMVDEVQRRFTIESQQVNLEVADCLVNGVVDAKDDDNDILNLRKGLQEFFRDNETGVLTSRKISVALWKNDEVYYCYDSHGRDEYGYISPIGTACVLRILNLDELANTIQANLGPDKDTALYNLSGVEVEIWEQTEDGEARPPLKNYTEVDAQSAILRSTWSIQSPYWKLNAGLQLVPMLLVALGMSKVYSSSDWNRQVIDEVLSIGDKLFETSLLANYNDENDDEEITVDNVVKEFKIGLNHFVIQMDRQINGNFDGFVESFTLFMNENVPDEDRREFLLSSSLISLVGWREGGVYYIFDPQPRDPFGHAYGKDEWSQIPPEPEEDEDEEELGEEEEEQLTESAPLAIAAAPETDVEEEEVTEVEELPPPKPKHSAHYWEAMSKDHGRANIMQFNSLEKMANFILEQTPPTKRSEEAFILYPVVIETEMILKNVLDLESNAVPEDLYSGDWYNFKEIEHGRWILKGEICQNHPMFPCYNRGQQYIPNGIIALAFAYLYAVKRFNKDTVDGILRYGDRLMTTSRNLRIKELLGDKELNLTKDEIMSIMSQSKFEASEIYNKFCVQEHMLFMTLEERFVKGEITAQDFEELYGVLSGLTYFFESNRFGILESKDTAVAVWKGEKVYYMFDPAARGPNGLSAMPGEACITRYLELSTMADIILKNLPKKGSNNFFIHKVEFTKDKCCIKTPAPEPLAVPDPPLSTFTKLIPGKWILRGTINQNDARFAREPNALSTSAAIISLTMTLLHKSQKWTKPIVDEVLYFADELYNDTVSKLGFDFNPWNQQLSIHLINKDYKIGKLEANCELRNTDQRGIIDIKDPKILNLRQGMERFFEENTHGVIQTDTLTVAIWEDEENEKIIYMYDPNPRGPTGLHALDGTACLLSFANKKLAADHFISNISDSQKRREFLIVPVEIVVGERRTKRAKKVCPKGKPTSPCPKTPTNKVRLPICDVPVCKDVTKLQLAGATIGLKKFATFEATRGIQGKLASPAAATPIQAVTGAVCPLKKTPKAPKKNMGKMELDIMGATYRSPSPAEKKKIMEMATAEYNFKLGMKLAKVGRTGFHELPSGDKLLRGMKSQTSRSYSQFSQGNQDIPNCLCFLVIFKLTPITSWTHKHIDLILDSGDSLYKDSYITYQPKDLKLGLDNVLRKFYIREVEVCLEIYVPSVKGLLLEDNLEAALVSFFYQENFCMLTSHDQWVAIYFKKGYYYMFDPHDRDLQGNRVEPGSPYGNACIIQYDDLRPLARKFISNVVLCPSESIKVFTLALAAIKTIKKAGKPMGR